MMDGFTLEKFKEWLEDGKKVSVVIDLLELDEDLIQLCGGKKAITVIALSYDNDIGDPVAGTFMEKPKKLNLLKREIIPCASEHQFNEIEANAKYPFTVGYAK